MDIHENARTTRHGRMLMIERLHAGWSVAAVADSLGVSAKTVRKWRDRFAAEGAAGLADRSSRPRCSPTRLSSQAAAEIEALRRQREGAKPFAQALSTKANDISRAGRLWELSAAMVALEAAVKSV